MASMGISGRVAGGFLRSKLTPLVTIAALTVGLLGLLATPREEEPQISVPMIDVILAQGYEIKDGVCSVPPAPGFGLAIDEAKFRSHAKTRFDLTA